MASTGLELLGMTLAVLGWLGTLVSCALPLWKVTAFIGNSIVVAQVVWEGLWMSCVVQSTGQMQCKVYDSLLALPQAGYTTSNRLRDSSRYTDTPSFTPKGHTPPTLWPTISVTSSKDSILAFV